MQIDMIEKIFKVNEMEKYTLQHAQKLKYLCTQIMALKGYQK